MRKMKRIGMTLLCLWGLVAGFTLGLHGAGGGDSKAQEWEMFLRDLPEATGAMNYISVMRRLASSWDYKVLQALDLPNKREETKKLDTSLDNLRDRLYDLYRSSQDEEVFHIFQTLNVNAWKGYQSGRAEAEKDADAYERWTFWSTFSNRALSKIATKLDEKIDIIKAFEQKYQSILNLETLPSSEEAAND